MDQLAPTYATDPAKPFSMKRKQAIDFVNQGIAAASTVPPNHQMGYQMIASAVDIDPELAHGWFALGNANSDMNLKAASVSCYRRALQCPESGEIGDLTPEFKAKTLCNMGHTLYHLGKHEEALEITLQSVAIDPTLAFGWINLSLLYSMIGEDKKSVECGRKALDLDPSNAIIETGLAFAYLHDKQYAKGLRHFEARFPYKLKQFLSYPYPQWKGQRNVTLFVVADQGLGDSIDFLRFVPATAERVKKVYLGVQQELLRLVRDMFGHIENIEFVPLPQPFPAATHWTTLMSLPTALYLKDEEIVNTPMPKFSVPDVGAPWKVEGKKMHVGIAWGGSRMNDVDAWRSIPIEQFLELARIKDVQFYSCQIGDRANDVHNIGAAPIFKDLAPYVKDVTDTLGVYRHLDLLITIDSAPGHIAGMMNLPCWIPVAYNGTCWRFSRHGRESIWYPNHRLYRQAGDADWKPVFEEIIKDLTEKVDAIS